MVGLKKHLVIPDCQITPNAPVDHLKWLGEYIVEKRPDVIVHLGDFADMESLSSYDKGKLSFEGRRYKKDIEASKAAMRLLVEPLRKLQARQRINKERLYKPDMHLVIGNHENRINKAIEDDPKLEGLISVDDLAYKFFGFKVHNFLIPVEIDGLTYAHYFYQKMSGRPYSGDSIDTRLKNIGFSFVSGHEQRYLVGVRSLNNGRRIRGLVHGACYLHDEDYRGPQANGELRGAFMLHEVQDGDYGLLEVSLDFLCRKYEGVRLHEFMQGKHPSIYEQSIGLKRRAA